MIYSHAGIFSEMAQVSPTKHSLSRCNYYLYGLNNLLFKHEDDLMSVLKDVFEVNDPVGIGAGRQHRDLVQDLHWAVDPASENRFGIKTLFQKD